MYVSTVTHLWLICCFFVYAAKADYQCLCNYQVETPMYGTQDSSMSPVGYLYEFDCKPITTSNSISSDWTAVMNVHMIAYVRTGDGLAVQVCQGSVPSEDKLTTAAGSSFTTTVTHTRTTVKAATTTSTTTTFKSDTPITTTIPQPAKQEATTSTITQKPMTVTSRATTTPPTEITTTKSTVTTTTAVTTVVTTPPTEITTTTATVKPTYTNVQATLSESTTFKQPITAQTTTPTTTPVRNVTTMSTTATTIKQYQQSTGQGNLHECPQSVTKVTDARWIRQYKNFCYEIVPNRYMDWYDALDDCRNRHGSAGGTLLEVYTSDIQQFVEQFLKDEGYNHPVWIGLQDVDREEHWDHWESDTKLTYDNFDPNRKNNYAHHSKEDCALLEPSGLWDDSVCDENAADAVADGDGFLMGRQVPFRHSWICQYPTEKQTTAQPTTISTSLKPTTSSISTTTNPVINVTGKLSLCPRVVRQSTDHSWIRQYNNFCYELVPRYEDWYEASQYCSSRGSTNGRLVEVYTPDIQHFITQFLREEDYRHPLWIGLQDVDKEERWDHWDSDIPLTYENFDPNRKNNYANHVQENCVLLEPSGFWDDSVCNEREANQAEENGHGGLPYQHSWICQYPIQQYHIFG